MPLNQLTQLYLPAIELELQGAVARTDGPALKELHTMLAYHLGWQGDGAGPSATGKRIRPILLLLTTQASGGAWQDALPAAAAVELVHNFSLIHDDIEDNSPTRRGRPTIWTRWGVPQAINTGDALFTIAHLSLLRLSETTDTPRALQAISVLQNACLQLTQGQHLDIAYEDQQELPLDAYWPMIAGKTAALLSACTELGAVIANAEDPKRAALQRFGRDLGLAFQVLDDILGIWGDAAKIGKSNASDLVAGKKSLPVLYGLAQQRVFHKRWLAGPIPPEEVHELADQLETEGARAFAQEEANRLTDSALQALAASNPQGDAGKALNQLAHRLLKREI